jgi:2-alkyl-3-oxoalkanoate reductase
MQVTIIGATGVLGRNLFPRLVRRGDRVRALARSAVRARSMFGSDLDAIDFDLLDPADIEQLPDLLQNTDAVVHIATAIPNDFQTPGAWDTNTRLRTAGTRTLLDAALVSGVDCYIQQSIVMAYPDGGDQWLDETTPLDTSPNRAAVNTPVITMETMVQAVAADRLSWCILRGGVFVGPQTFQDCTRDQLRAGTLVVAGDGRNFVSQVHVADMAEAIVAALDRAPAGSIFNITADPIREGAYLDRLAEIEGAPAPWRDRSLPRPSSFRCTHAAASRLLAWEPQHSIWPK